MLDNSTASRVLSVVYATKAITKIIYDRVLSVVYATKAITNHYDRVLSVVYATKAITKIIYRIALGRSRRRAQWPRTRHSDELFNELERSGDSFQHIRRC